MEVGEVSAGEVITAGSALPENHEDQLQLGFRLIQNAYNSKMASLEQEARGLRLTCEEQKNQAAGLQRKNSALEVELVEGHQRAQQLAEENKELFKTVSQLRRQLSRLEGLKKSVLDSIADHQQAECEVEDNRLYMRDDYLKGSMPLTMAAVQSEAVMPAATPPPATPVSAVDSYAAESTTATDGKQFFKKARNSLSYQAFNDFLANIKRLNQNDQTREETLEQARRIFGPEHQHLYSEFEQLLNRHASPMM
mmetsp:Transcript_85819/g.199492  ORF Transcript_85819/g.199492 Transcript_85819/m.199492 type:complete len:252 (+) Transcript_85819:88-843(+)